MKKSMLYKAVLAAMLVGASSAALAVDEAEYNAPINAAQELTIGQDGAVTVSASLSSDADMDYFSFRGKAGNVVTIDIDGAWKGVVGGSFNSTIALFGPIPVAEGNYDANFHMWANSNDSTVDEGSMPFGTTTSTRDSRIDRYALPSDGVYVVGVTTSNKIFRHGGGADMLVPTTMPTGTYTLIVSGVTPPPPPMTHVNIDVKPGNKQVTRLNPKAKGVVPVAILSKEGFDPLTVDMSTLGFGVSGNEKNLQGCHKDGKDYNGDGKPDLMCHFHNEATNFVVGDTMGVVKGKFGGNKKDFEGRGSLKVLPEDRE